MRHIFLLAFVPIGFCSAYAADASSPTSIDGASRDEVKNDLVLRLMQTGRYRLVQDTPFQLAFERDADQSSVGKLPYQSGPPLDRFVYTVATDKQGVEVIASVFTVRDSDTPLERRAVLKMGKEVDEANQVILSLKTELEAKKSTSVKARPGVAFQSTPVQKRGPHLAANHHWKATASQTLGFSAQSSSFDASDQGLVITSVDPKTPAARAGLRAADRVVSVDGQPVNTSQDMQSMSTLIAGKKHGAIALIRNGKTVEAHLDM